VSLGKPTRAHEPCGVHLPLTSRTDENSCVSVQATVETTGDPSVSGSSGLDAVAIFWCASDASHEGRVLMATTVDVIELCEFQRNSTINAGYAIVIIIVIIQDVHNHFDSSIWSRGLRFATSLFSN